ncbi:MAG TPA: NAD(P)/FAD-dependent oxidoreductase [Polyangiaceae bacterium]|nr:NAD(P)/FAD-dependent oxidoreductase [Polyangiaceae bacterium]
MAEAGKAEAAEVAAVNPVSNMADEGIIIVGGGVAGMVAARALADAGRSVDLIEARDRLGGRVLQQRDPDWPMPIELGAEFVHGRPPPTLRLLKEAGLSLQPVEDRHYWSGSLVPDAPVQLREVWGFNARARRLLRSVRRDGPDCSAAEFVRRCAMHTEDRALFELYVEGFHAAPIGDVSIQSLALDAEESSSEEPEQFRVQEGYGALVDWLAQQLAGVAAVRVHLQSVVRSVSWERGHVRVDVEQGDRSRQFEAERVLITVPLGVLAAPSGLGIDFYPPLEQKQAAFGVCAMGHAAKVVLRFREALWAPEVSPDWQFLHDAQGSFQTFWRQCHGTAQQITAWAGGPRARIQSVRWEATAAREVVATLSRLLGVPVERALSSLIGFQGSAFEHDPFARGAYSYVRPGGGDVHERLAEPIADTLFFAGEATDGEFPATVAGAIQSGERAAREISAGH